MRPGLGFSHLKKVRFHKLNDKCYDRKGPIATLFFESFPNTEWHRQLVIESIRIVISLLNPSHSFMTLKEYDHNEIAFCWVYYGTCLNEERHEAADNKWIPARVDHKYWSESEIETFKEIIHALAKRHGAEVVGYA
jgi:hypothetical protein